MLRRGFAAAAIILAFATPGLATAQTTRQEAADRYTEGALRVSYDGVIAFAEAEQPYRGPFMVENPGNAVALVVGCENNCREAQVVLRAAGLPDLRASGDSVQPRTVVLQIPERYTRSPSSFEVEIGLSCINRERTCMHRWGLLSRGPAPAPAARGMPETITDAQWNSAADARPRWAARPSGDDIRFFYPASAWREGREGQASLQCLIGQGGALACRVANETPVSEGFGEAALRLATQLRAAETDAEGQPLAGRRLTVPITFQQAGS